MGNSMKMPITRTVGVIRASVRFNLIVPVRSAQQFAFGLGRPVDRNLFARRKRFVASTYAGAQPGARSQIDFVERIEAKKGDRRDSALGAAGGSVRQSRYPDALGADGHGKCRVATQHGPFDEVGLADEIGNEL